MRQMIPSLFCICSPMIDKSLALLLHSREHYSRVKNEEEF
jgi:hypothetical protein